MEVAPSLFCSGCVAFGVGVSTEVFVRYCMENNRVCRCVSCVADRVAQKGSHDSTPASRALRLSHYPPATYVADRENCFGVKYMLDYRTVYYYAIPD